MVQAWFSFELHEKTISWKIVKEYLRGDLILYTLEKKINNKK